MQCDNQQALVLEILNWTKKSRSSPAWRTPASKGTSHPRSRRKHIRKKYNALLAKYEKAKARLGALAAEKERRQNRDREIKILIQATKTKPLFLEKWDERLWAALIDRAAVRRDGGIVFRFKNGMDIEVYDLPAGETGCVLPRRGESHGVRLGIAIFS